MMYSNIINIINNVVGVNGALDLSELVFTGVDLVLYSLNTIKVWKFDDNFVFDIIHAYDKNLTPRKNHPSINMVHYGVDSKNNLGIQRFSHLYIPTIYQIWLVSR